ncbi:MAG: hypothetical protein H6622_07405 [Halobacteriovoraceae bacterium]|nr:hypothetical protein [Halobacteriovoraceae bacterium]
MEKEKVLWTKNDEVSRLKMLIREKKLFQAKTPVRPASCRPGRSVLKKQSIRPASFVKGE